MPSIFKKKKVEAPAPAQPIDINETITKLNRQLEDARQQELKARECAKNAMRNNNTVMAKSYMSQVKMAQQTQKNLNGQLSMLQMKQNQMATFEAAKNQVTLMKQINEQMKMQGSENLMEEFQDTMQESAQQQQEAMQMTEMMNQFSEQVMGMYDQDNELDQDMELLQAEVQQEKLSGIASPEKAPEQVEQVQEKKPVAENDLDALL